MTHALHGKVFHHSKVPMKDWKWKNFSPRELACKGSGLIQIDANALDRLQRLRDALNRPLLITSAYRSESHNRRVGGAPGSYHLKGQAFDIRMENQDPQKFVTLARSVGFDGIGLYPKQGFIHVDTGPKRTWGDAFPQNMTNTGPEPDEKTSAGTSSTVGAAAGGLVTVAGSGLTAVSQLSGTAQLVAIGFLALIALAFIWIMRERIRKLMDAD